MRLKTAGREVTVSTFRCVFVRDEEPAAGLQLSG